MTKLTISGSWLDSEKLTKTLKHLVDSFSHTTFSSSLDCTVLLTFHDHLIIHLVHALIGNIRTSISSKLHRLYRKDGRLYWTDSQLNGSSTVKHADNVLLLQSNGLYDGARRSVGLPPLATSVRAVPNTA